MDSEEEQGTWIGGIYKKVGTLCSRIDNITSQVLFLFSGVIVVSLKLFLR